MPHPWYMVGLFVFASMLMGLSLSLAQGFLSANTRQIAGDLGIAQTQATWLLVAYMIPRASLTLLLFKLRAQYGLRPFAMVGITAYSIAMCLSFFVNDFHSAVAVQFLSGICGAPLGSLAFLYMLECLPPQKKLSFGLPMALTFIMVGMYLARVISPPLWDLGGWQAIKCFQFGLVLLALPFIMKLPLAHAPRMKVIHTMDLVSYCLIAVGFGGILAAFAWATTDWWTSTTWLGWTLAVAGACLTVAVVIELNRKSPLMDIRWMLSPEILHLTGVLLIFRIVLSEQSTGAPYLFTSLGLGNWQIQPLFMVIVLAYLAAGLLLSVTLTIPRVPYIHILALSLIMVGAWMDSHSTVQTRPEQMYLSQGMIAFAGAIFLPSTMAKGLVLALAKGPAYLLSFIVIFLSTQSLGGIIGSGLFRTFIRVRTAFHNGVLKDGLMAGDTSVTAQITTMVKAYSTTITDPLLRKAEAAAALASSANTQATVLAYNDAFLLTSMIAAAALILLLGHLAVLKLQALRAEPVSA
ncbi:MFS transporter [Pseudooceanicola sp. CBS1P-1]|uniref:MFS transporter n=1 Tax=Pseudooceanicola albus TaxID=2692189 RepID=A0A6L7FY04_9RHOB|nr:MFS transporter [Pseudooceanicola endophyticus]MXN16645.1 MFS transporter [Pseudooceanicola albus]